LINKKQQRRKREEEKERDREKDGVYWTVLMRRNIARTTNRELVLMRRITIENS
jgi:hypothetical protein